MANRRCIFSDGHWCGNVTSGGQTVKSCFEIFPSGRGWSLLFGKPLLKQFKAIHNYGNDTLKIPSNGMWTTLLNECEGIPIARSVKDSNINTNINENPTNTVSKVPTRSTNNRKRGCGHQNCRNQQKLHKNITQPSSPISYLKTSNPGNSPLGSCLHLRQLPTQPKNI